MILQNVEQSGRNLIFRVENNVSTVAIKAD